jgi:hypothetical protein
VLIVVLVDGVGKPAGMPLRSDRGVVVVVVEDDAGPEVEVEEAGDVVPGVSDPSVVVDEGLVVVVIGADVVVVVA